MVRLRNSLDLNGTAVELRDGRSKPCPEFAAAAIADDHGAVDLLIEASGGHGAAKTYDDYVAGLSNASDINILVCEQQQLH